LKPTEKKRFLGRKKDVEVSNIEEAYIPQGPAKSFKRGIYPSRHDPTDHGAFS
jgi:hypothetical protein